mmetsp:Transcript_120184/g.256483  ORF Transcript_120184/g.256483 Transcript_120184/m.256483 type:complete len:378 (+) Transcript_120184:154-1287(+)
MRHRYFRYSFLWLCFLCGPGGAILSRSLDYQTTTASVDDVRELPAKASAPSATGGKYAFVMMAFDPPGAPLQSLWGVLPMAHAVRDLSAYPLVLLTNTSQFPHGSDVAMSLSKLGVQVHNVQPVPVPQALLEEHHHMPCEEHHPSICGFQYLKLQIWNLTQFDKLIWMDSDAILTRGVDEIFQQHGVWAQQDNWDCGSYLSQATRWSESLWKAVDWLERELPGEAPKHQSEGVCSGFLLLEPSEKTYLDIIDYMGTLVSAPGGDQQVIADFFETARQDPVRLLPVSTASFGMCIGRGIPGGGLPAFVHKSGWHNRCFQLGPQTESCKTNPLGSYWHKRFCLAAFDMGVSMEFPSPDFCANIFHEDGQSLSVPRLGGP